MYQKTEWKTGDIVTSKGLNNIETQCNALDFIFNSLNTLDVVIDWNTSTNPSVNPEVYLTARRGDNVQSIIDMRDLASSSETGYTYLVNVYQIMSGKSESSKDVPHLVRTGLGNVKFILSQETGEPTGARLYVMSFDNVQENGKNGIAARLQTYLYTAESGKCVKESESLTDSANSWFFN